MDIVDKVMILPSLAQTTDLEPNLCIIFPVFCRQSITTSVLINYNFKTSKINRLTYITCIYVVAAFNYALMPLNVFLLQPDPVEQPVQRLHAPGITTTSGRRRNYEDSRVNLTSP